MNILIALITGITGAVVHVLSGPDHLAAVIPFAIEEKRKSWKVGFAWGLGHLTGMLSIGLLFYFLKQNINIESFSAYSEVIVGITLIGIGIWAVAKALGYPIHKKHWHLHISDTSFVHRHHGDIHDTSVHGEHTKEETINNRLSAFYIGTVHGFAGIAHFILFLPILGFDNTGQIFSYIAGFAIGTVLAMLVFAVALGQISFRMAANGNKNSTFKILRLASGIFAIAIGIYWIMASILFSSG